MCSLIIDFSRVTKSHDGRGLDYEQASDDTKSTVGNVMEVHSVGGDHDGASRFFVCRIIAVTLSHELQVGLSDSAGSAEHPTGLQLDHLCADATVRRFVVNVPATPTLKNLQSSSAGWKGR